MGKLTTALLCARGLAAGPAKRARRGKAGCLLTAARSPTELISGLGRAAAVPRRAMAMAVREKRMVGGVLVVFFFCVDG